MKKGILLLTVFGALLVLGVSGTALAAQSFREKALGEDAESPAVEIQEMGEWRNETEICLSVQSEASPEQSTEATEEDNDFSPAPAENHEPAFVKVSEDDSPEGKLAEMKAWLASEAEFSAMINAEKQSLEAQKTEILSAVKGDVALMSAAQTAEIARIDDRLEEIWMNHSTLTDDPDFYDYEKYFVRHMTDTVNQSSVWLEMGFFAPDSHEYYHNTGLVEICTAALEMYNEGAEVDEAYLYYYESLEKLINYQW